MIIKWSAKLSGMAAGVVVLTMFSACSSQQTDSASSGAAQVATAGGQKCEVDAKRVCQEMRKESVVSSNGLTEDATAMEHSQPRTMDEFISFQVPNGSLLEVSCQINTAHRSVVYAHVMPGVALTPTDVAYLQNGGYCVH